MRSPAALRNVAQRHPDDGAPLHRFRTLLRDLATRTRKSVRLGEARFQQLTTPTALPQRVFPRLDGRM